MESKKFILTISCQDRLGLVAKITSFLAHHQGFITELAQFGDTEAGRFFMRCEFQFEERPLSFSEFAKDFTPLAEELGLQWKLYDPLKKVRVLVLVSKLGHCLNDLLHQVQCGSLPIEIPAIVSNHKDLEEMAASHKIPFFHWPVDAKSKQEQEKKLISFIEKEKIDLVVLARYMQILSPELTQKLSGMAINIHHSFLPSFKGAKPYHQAFERGVKLIGATAHYVTDQLDEGQIIEQEVLRVNHAHSPSDLVEMGRDIERTVLTRAIKYHIERRVFINGLKTIIFR